MRTKHIITALLLGACSSIASAESSDWTVHGFGDVSVKNDYVTPRGLVVTTKGTTVQIVNGLVLVAPNGVTFHAGIWTDLNPGYSKADGNITAVNEFDYFFGIDYNITDKINIGAEYVQFISGQPSVAFKDEYNVEFHVKYKDGDGSSPLTFNPYAKLFWAVESKSSTVVTGKAGNTFDVELGAVPTYKMDKVTLSAPTWITVGPKSYWGGTQNVGVVSTGLKASTPLSFLKGAAGFNVYAQVQYFHLLNDKLVLAKSILNSGDKKRDHAVFGVGLGYGF